MSTQYNVIYETENVYENPVNEAHFQFLVLPMDTNFQSLKRHYSSNNLNIEPEVFTDNEGFRKIKLTAKKPFKRLEMQVMSYVEVYHFNPFEFNLSTIERDAEVLKNHEFIIDNYWYIALSKGTKVTNKHSEEILKYNWDKNVFQYLNDLNNYIHEKYEFDVAATNIHIHLDEVMDVKKGVCQDFAHLFIMMSRLNGIPARYVSGYINQGSNFIGDAQMHAWVEAYVPDVGWVGFDPTNNLVVDHHYIKVCHGIDYFECPPIKGVLKTDGFNYTRYNVTVLSQQSQQ